MMRRLSEHLHQPQIDPQVFPLLAGMLSLGLLVVVLAIFWRFKKPAAKG